MGGFLKILKTGRSPAISGDLEGMYTDALHVKYVADSAHETPFGRHTEGNQRKHELHRQSPRCR